jgi:uncharacterized protein YodC (DUF2158 family)
MEMYMEFQIGDVVRLKSFGPKMTVDRLNAATGELECSWFVGVDRKQEWFVATSLKLVRDEALQTRTNSRPGRIT